MKYLIPFSFLFLSMGFKAAAEESNVYRCWFGNGSFENPSVRMKKYFNPSAGMYLGKVDLLEDSAEKETTLTKVYQIPLQDEQNYMQIWYAKDLRVDAELSFNQGITKFRATYNKNSEKLEMICVELKN
ncbi:MAG: cell wall hydrolase [Bdellovibrio sp.]